MALSKLDGWVLDIRGIHPSIMASAIGPQPSSSTAEVSDAARRRGGSRQRVERIASALIMVADASRLPNGVQQILFAFLGN